MNKNKIIFFVFSLIVLCNLIYAYSITTFSDGTSTGNITFTGGMSIYKNISLPYWAIVNKTELDLQGFQSQSEDDAETSWSFEGDGTDNANAVDEDFGTYMRCGTTSRCNISENFTVPFSIDSFIWFAKFLSIGGTLDIYFYNYTASNWELRYTDSTFTFLNITLNTSGSSVDDFISSGNPFQVKTVLDASGAIDTVQYYEGKVNWNKSFYPTNITIRTNNEITYQNLSNFTGTVTDIDLNISSLQNCINLCSESVGNYCNCTLNFTSARAGILEYSNLEVDYFVPLNITFKNERDDTLIEGETFSIYLETTGFSQLYTSSNPFKVNLTTTGTYDVKVSSTNYPSREYSIDVLEARNDLILYLINLTDSVEKTFNIVDEGLNPLENVFVVFVRLIGGTWTTIAREYSDYAGQVKLDLDENYKYTINFSKTNYEDRTITLEPKNAEYVIKMISTIGKYNQSVYEGIRYRFEPSNIVLNNNTKYNFTFTLNSSTWPVTNCTLKLYNNTILLNETSSFTSDSCYIRIEQNTASMTNITSEAIYELQSTYEFTVSQQYSVIYTYVGDFSLKSFLDDLSDFAMAGFDDFGRMILALIVIFIITSLAAQKVGFTNPEVLIFLVIAQVWFFSYVNWLYLDFMPIPIMTHPVTGAIIFNTKKYIIAILVSLAGGAFVMRKFTE